jgi:hypothetical protein
MSTSRDHAVATIVIGAVVSGYFSIYFWLSRLGPRNSYREVYASTSKAAMVAGLIACGVGLVWLLASYLS